MEHTLLDDILRLKDILPKKQRILCQYLALNYEQISVMTVAELANKAGVGTTTVMRLIQTLGCDSFNTFKRELANLSLVQNATSYRGLKQSFVSSKKTESSDTFRSVMADGMRILENLCTPSNIDQFEKAVQTILGSEHTYTLGLRSSQALALYFEYSTGCFYPHIRQLSLEGEFLYDRISVYMKPTDCLLVFSVWPCTQKTIQAAKLCHTLGIPVILITNTNLNPLVPCSDVVIDANCVNHLSGNVAIFSIIEALAVELGRRTDPESTKNLERIEQLLKENNLIVREN